MTTLRRAGGARGSAGTGGTGGGGIATYDAATAYPIGAQVISGGHVWKAVAASTGVTPEEGATWTRIVAGVTPADATDAELAAAIAALPAPKKRSWSFSRNGSLAVSTGSMRLYNRTGATITLAEVYVAVGTAPTGAALTLALRKDAALVSGAAPSVAATANTGSASGSFTWESDSYLTLDITQIGSTVAGADLVVTLTEA